MQRILVKYRIHDNENDYSSFTLIYNRQCPNCTDRVVDEWFKGWFGPKEKDGLYHFGDRNANILWQIIISEEQEKLLLELDII